MANKYSNNPVLFNFSELPGFRHLRRRLFLWLMKGERGTQTRTLLYLDLAEATRLGTPLDEALEMIAQGHERVRVLAGLIPFYIIFPYAPVPMIRADRTVKLLAWYLLPHVRQGLSLSQAMGRLGKAFGRQDVLIAEMGEIGGMLPVALKRLSDYRHTDIRFEKIVYYLYYPVTITIAAFLLISFIIVMIIPKFQAIYEELGGQLPAITQFAIKASERFVKLTPTFLLLFLALYLPLLFITRSIVGRRTGSPFLIPHIIPIFRRMSRTVRNSRWMAAFTLMLDAGGSAEDAIEQAGKISGGALETRSNKAARLVEQGLPIGEACIRCKVLDPWMNHRLGLIDWHGDYVEKVHGIVEDAERRLSDGLDRLGKRVQVLSILVVGLIVALTAFAIYMPLFNIPRMMLSAWQ